MSGLSSVRNSTVGSDQTIFSGESKIAGIIFHAAAAGSIIVYDGPSASGKEKLQLTVTAAGPSLVCMLPSPISCTTSIVVVLSGAGNSVTVLYTN